jgi:hypothetical protein
MKRIDWFFRWLPCFLFGHTGTDTESGYHVCSRCGLYGYWSFRETSGQLLWIEYSNAGLLIDLWERLSAHRRNSSENSSDGDDLPF